MLAAMFGEARMAMGANRMRTFLTMLGMVIGVSAVVLMMAMGQGAQAAVKRAIDSMGSHLFIVLSGSSNQAGVRTGSGGAPTLSSDDAEAIARLPGVQAAAPVSQGNYQLVYGTGNWNTQVIGTTPDYFQARDWRLSSGDPFDSNDIQRANRVALVGRTVASNLFGEDDPLGKTLRIRNAPFTIIGVLAPKGQSLDGRDQDDTVIVPFTTAQRSLSGSRFRNATRLIMVQAASDEVMNEVELSIANLLRDLHRLRPGADDDFTVRNLTALANSAAETARTMSLLLGGIASVSLLVGGIGIMNIMLVSVTERTREIGIRLAIGARGRDILSQFLIEALLLSLTGGAIGLALGVAGAWGIAYGWQTEMVIESSAALVAFGVSAITGVFFGLYPAWKAARLDPIEALRFQ